MKIAIASDHGGFEFKEKIKKHYENRLNLNDLGTFSLEPCDFPDVAKKMAEEIISKKADLGILLCGTGIGISIAVNRYKGIRGALIYDEFSAQMAKEHNNANVMIFGGRTMKFIDIIKYIDIFMKASFAAQHHLRRIDKLDNL